MQKFHQQSETNLNKLLADENIQDSYPQNIFIKFLKDVLTFGTIGFSTFFTLILITKFFRYLFSLDAQLVFEVKDIEYSLFGFFLLSLYKIIESDKQ